MRRRSGRLVSLTALGRARPQASETLSRSIVTCCKFKESSGNRCEPCSVSAPNPISGDPTPSDRAFSVSGDTSEKTSNRSRAPRPRPLHFAAFGAAFGRLSFSKLYSKTTGTINSSIKSTQRAARSKSVCCMAVIPYRPLNLKSCGAMLSANLPGMKRKVAESPPKSGESGSPMAPIVTGRRDRRCRRAAAPVLIQALVVSSPNEKQ